ncbi:MAG: peptidoglycan-associated lipoprotein Pal [Deltaproteobacteria bacterium]|jgi:peptidoglycan-associated lipoprotein|nr:peptidoglycan-associated lipoprotein Pal [Deltaproteobacteria bacterium]
MRKNVWLIILLVVVLLAMFFTVSCTKKVVKTEPASMSQTEVSNIPDKSSEIADQTGQQQEDRSRTEATAREAAEKAFVNEYIHFSFDSAVLSDHAQQILNSKANYMQANSSVRVTVEGHCDERGTESYNIALGEKRAESVKNFLVDLGISANRLNTISYGEERPFAIGHDEHSWAKNRRAQFMIN